MIFIYATLFLWMFFIVAANFKEKYEAKLLDKYNVWLGKTIITLFVIFDAFYNIFFATILFLDLPKVERLLLTARLKYYLKTESDSWRGKLAMFMCKYMIEPWHRGHCNL